ncbi:S-layer homology domain-containing protein [Paenibacillus sp. R14(2021)]|uniref:S-layer homology domain-containing protein n=1 Tax=Paenibacillus sp. R14(2021) TaxID=2859228 RepID=UPI001C6147C5|nr:S-layer homology domain-containing protein [Paenibacillus sp. R14(2021)]
MKRFSVKGLVIAPVLALVLLSGCVAVGVGSVTISYSSGEQLSSSEHAYVRYSDGTVTQANDPAQGMNSAVTTTDSSKTIVGGYVSDGTVSWVPGFNANSTSYVNLSAIEANKPSLPVGYVVQGKPIADSAHPGFTSVPYNIYGTDGNLVNGQTEVFISSADPNTVFYNIDVNDTNFGGITTVRNGFSWHTVNGMVSFSIQGNPSDIANIPLSFHSGQALISPVLTGLSDAGVTIAAPSAGSAPVNAAAVEAATANPDFTVTGVTWNEALTASGKFKASQAYTATVTLTSKSGTSFLTQGVTPTAAGSTGVSAATTSGTGEGNTVTFTATYGATAPLALGSIAVSKQPAKLSYVEGTDGVLELDGMIVTETNNDGTTVDVPFASGTADGYTTSPANGTALTVALHDGAPVTITHTASGKTTGTNPLTVVTDLVPIGTASIVGVTPPVRGASPVSAIAATNEYTAAIAWSPAASVFAPSTVYTATITLTPKAGYTLTGVSKNFFTVAGASSVTNDADSGIVTAVFPATAAAPSPIGTAAIVGVTPPVRNASPVSAIAATNEYTAAIAWSPAASVFAPSTAYTATITLTPKAGYTLTGISKNFFTVAGAASVTNNADSGIVTAVFPATASMPSSGGSSAPVNDTPVVSTDGTLTLPVGHTGEVSLDDAVKVSIPAGATDKELKLTIQKLTNTQQLLTDDEVLASPVFEILKNFSENFSKPVTLTFAFDPKALSGTQKAVVCYYDEAKKAWVEVGGTVNGNHITAEVNHFTKYAVMVVGEGASQPADPGQGFSDVAGHWAEQGIKEAVGAGFVKGYPDGTFKPNQTVTRAEFAVMLANALQLHGDGAKLTFKDSAEIGDWAREAIASAVKAGIIHGYEDGTFRPNAVITRAEMATMIATATGLKIEADADTGFADDAGIPAWARGGVALVKETGIVQGKGGNRFAPQDHATRAEAVTVLLNLLAQASKGNAVSG